MIEFHLSSALAADLKMHIQQAPPGFESARALQWYGHRITVARRKCVIMMELRSRYAMVFCGLTKNEFNDFPDIFQDRLWREVISICALENDEDIGLLSELVLNLGVVQCYAEGSNRSVQSHIYQVGEYLSWWVNNQIHALPLEMQQAFAFGLAVNEIPRHSNGSKQCFQPFQVFRDFWLGLLQQFKEGTQLQQLLDQAGAADKPSQLPAQAASSNVIEVDFLQRRRR